MQSLLATCETDGVLPLVQKHVPLGSKVLESGCGAARYVRYLQDRGWRTVGLEFSAHTVRMVHEVWHDLKVVQGDAANSPFPEGHFDAVLSLGVIEHFPEGPAAPLRDICRVLRPGGIAIITVPCLNCVRQLKRMVWWDELVTAPRALAAQVIKRRKMPLNRLKRGYMYQVFPPRGEFHEYRMTKREFREEVRRAGLQAVEYVPLGTIDGIFHELNPFKAFVRFRNWTFHVTSIARCLDTLLADHPFFHCHMQAVVARKSLGQRDAQRNERPRQ